MRVCFQSESSHYQNIKKLGRYYDVEGKRLLHRKLYQIWKILDPMKMSND